jgi:ADP-heptose:LPS heptosyltransferase
MKTGLRHRLLENSRVPGRLLVLALLLLRLPPRWFFRRPPESPRHILVLHHLLLGDTVMLAGLFAKLRAQYPEAVLRLATPQLTVPLFSARPWGVDAYPFNPRKISTLIALFRLPKPDLAIIPAENRYSPLVAALGARWIVGFERDRPAWKNWFVDDLRPYPTTPTAWPDMASMLVDGPPPAPFKPTDWPAPASSGFEPPAAPWCVLHVGASSSLRHWLPENWRAIAKWLTDKGYTVVWSAGREEEDLVRHCDPEARYASFAGRLSLAGLWHLLAGAALLVSPDTGIAHLGKAAGTQCVTLFGPGSALIYGPGNFFSGIPYRAVTIDPFPCRDGKMLFERTHVSWVRHCARPPSACASPRCMEAITVEAVCGAIDELLPTNQ